MVIDAGRNNALCPHGLRRAKDDRVPARELGKVFAVTTTDHRGNGYPGARASTQDIFVPPEDALVSELEVAKRVDGGDVNASIVEHEIRLCDLQHARQHFSQALEVFFIAGARRHVNV